MARRKSWEAYFRAKVRKRVQRFLDRTAASNSSAIAATLSYSNNPIQQTLLGVRSHLQSRNLLKQIHRRLNKLILF